jgi:hypothetical protein
MPRKDVIHDAVRSALIKAGWTITDDPYFLKYGDEDMFVDLAAERLLAAERGEQKIAVEIKSFIGRSPMNDLENALGQYALYLSVLEEVEPNRKLYLAIGKATYDELNCMKPFGLIVKRFQVALIVVEAAAQEIVEWRD